MPAVSAVVPAAGMSSRMGGLNKLLQPWGDSTVVGAVVRTLLSCDLEVVVVTGHQADEVRRAVSPARTVHNPAYATGLGSTLAVGVGACQSADAYLLTLSDMPGINPEVVRALLDRYAREPARAIVAPVYEGEPDRMGHPILFDRAYRNELLALSGDIGARSVIQMHSDRVIRVAATGWLRDLDRPEDFLDAVESR